MTERSASACPLPSMLEQEQDGELSLTPDRVDCHEQSEHARAHSNLLRGPKRAKRLDETSSASSTGLDKRSRERDIGLGAQLEGSSGNPPTPGGLLQFVNIGSDDLLAHADIRQS